MPSLFKRSAVSGAILAGIAGAVPARAQGQAQSVAALPLQGGKPAQTAVTQPFGSR
jgi:hypothetical protein